MNTERITPTFAQLVADAAITITTAPALGSPTADPTWDHWQVCLTIRGTKVLAPYSMGLGFRVYKRSIGQHTLHIANRKPIKDGTPAYSVYPPLSPRAIREYFTAIPPTLHSVLQSLQSDCHCIDNTDSFEDFASEMGYDTDSRKALALYEAIKRTRQDLRQAFGSDLHRDFMAIDFDAEG